MMKAMYTGVSGLKVHQTQLDVISNNVANVNTVGYKKSTITFKEVYSETVKGAGSPQNGIGGTNPQQIGLGVNVGSIAVNHTAGSTEITNNPTDLMIDGSGYFILSNDVNNQNLYYTRDGSFTVDSDGYLVASNGYKVLDENLQPIQINTSDTKEATATSEIQIKGNINVDDKPSTDPNTGALIPAYETTMTVYDSLGDTHNLTVEYWDVYTDPLPPTDPNHSNNSFREIVIKDEDGTVLYGSTAPNTNAADAKYLKFDSFGDFSQVTADNTDFLNAAAPLDTTINIDIDGAEDITFNINDDTFKDANDQGLITQYSSNTDVIGEAVDGNSAGSITEFTINPVGEVVTTFSNGQSEILATIGLAEFSNSSGLMKEGGNMFTETPNSGIPQYGSPSTGSFGKINPGALEMSNVDLAQETTKMIVAQRGFQANSRIISTADSILEELVNLKR